jgi:hypothetical protein
MLQKIYFLSFEKNYGLRKGKVILFMYRKEKKWLLTHRLNEAKRLNIFQLHWYYFLFRLYRKRNKKFFGYQHPFGIVRKNKAIQPVSISVKSPI